MNKRDFVRTLGGASLMEEHCLGVAGAVAREAEREGTVIFGPAIAGEWPGDGPDYWASKVEAQCLKVSGLRTMLHA